MRPCTPGFRASFQRQGPRSVVHAQLNRRVRCLQRVTPKTDFPQSDKRRQNRKTKRTCPTLAPPPIRDVDPFPFVASVANSNRRVLQGNFVLHSEISSFSFFAVAFLAVSLSFVSSVLLCRLSSLALLFLLAFAAQQPGQALSRAWAAFFRASNENRQKSIKQSLGQGLKSTWICRHVTGAVMGQTAV